jgi:SET domain-containing protein
MTPEPDPDCWLHPGIEVRDSPIEGRGLFATDSIPANIVVSHLGGRLISSAELGRLIKDPDHPYVDSITVSETEHLLLPPRRPNGYGNHSCDPNLWWTGPYDLSTRRPIAAGEELTNDYATSTGDATFRMPCNCGSELCRAFITGTDWTNPTLQERYGLHWIPELLNRIAQR